MLHTCSYRPQDSRTIACLTAPSIGGADFQQPYRINDVRPRNREENDVLPERCGIRMNKFVAIQSFSANAPILFRDLKSAESSPWQSLVPRELFLPATRSLSWCCLDSGVSRPIWIPNMKGGAWVCSDFLDLLQRFRNFFRERLFSGVADHRRDVYRTTCECHQTSIWLGVLQIACCTPAGTAAEPVPVWLLLTQLVQKVRRVGIRDFLNWMHHRIERRGRVDSRYA